MLEKRIAQAWRILGMRWRESKVVWTQLRAKGLSFVWQVLEALDLKSAEQLWASRALPIKRQLRIVGLAGAAALIVILFSMGANWLIPAMASQSHSAGVPVYGVFKPTPEQLASLTVAPVKRMIFKAQVVTDSTIAVDDDIATPVYSPFSGRVTRLIARAGDDVKAGAPLMAVEASEFVQVQNDLITAVSALNSARAQLNLAQTNEKREHELFDSRGAALKDWQQSQSDLATATGNYHSAEIGLASVRNRLKIFGKSDAEIAALQRASIARSSNPEAVIPAPIDGTVIQRQVGLGQYIQAASSNPVYTIGNLSTVWLVASVREADAPLIQMGDTVEVRVLALPGRLFTAKISYIASSIDPNTRRLAVRADIPNPDGALKPAMFANFTIVTGQDSATPGVPQSAIVYDGETARVWELSRNGELVSRQIQLGKTNGDMMEVVAGLAPGARIVTRGAIFIDRAATGDSNSDD
jgi:membrane fusion protein, heavy metal efflux system